MAEVEIGVAYPADWSKKRSHTQLRPHLSTIDAIVSTIAMCSHLLRARGRDPAEAEVRRLTIRAGQTPVESLSAVGSSLSFISDSGDGNIFLKGKVGGMSLGVELRVGEDGIAALPPSASDASDLENYWSRTQGRHQVIDDLKLDGQHLAKASLLVEDSWPDTNAALDFRPGFSSLVDLFVAHLQVGQIMLYELDRLERSDSNTLWMRSTDFVRESSSGHDGRRILLETSLEDIGLHKNAEGKWRTATVTGVGGGVIMRCSVAHLLPDEE